MTKSIVVGVNPFHDDGGPVALAGLLARTTGAPVVAVAAYPHDTLLSRAASPAFERATADEAARALTRVRAELDGLAITTRAVASASPARAVHDVASEVGAGLIVVGSKHGGRIGHLLPGGVTDQVMTGAACPVAIAPRGYVPDRATIQRVGVAFVDTPEGREALRGGVALARRTGGRVEAVTMLEPTLWNVGWPGVVMPELVLDEIGDLERRQAAAIADAVGPDHGIDASVLGDGHLSHLAEWSAHLDVLLAGSRGYGPVRMVLLGSVSHWLARTARCPLIVLPRGSHDALDELVSEPAEGVAS
jgi:nucleotide-binding universal stress UspA family protein